LFPRLNSALSEYLKTSRARTGASVALTVTAAAGVGAASTAAGAQPWTASLNSMARAGHASNSTKAEAGKNIFGTVAGSSRSADQVAGTHAAPVVSASPAAHGPVKVDADQRQDHAGAPKVTPPAPVKTHGFVGGLLPAPPKHHVAAGKPAPAARKALAPSKAPTAKPAAPSHPSTPPSKPYTLYDSTHPGDIPSGHSQVAVYANGSFQASWGSVSGRNKVLWIDCKGSNPGSNVLDVEPGDASPSTAASWVQARENKEPGSIAIVYTMLSEWSAVKSAIGSLPDSAKSHVRYWIADPTGQKHVVPGSSATQWSWGTNYDTTEALPSFDH